MRKVFARLSASARGRERVVAAVVVAAAIGLAVSGLWVFEPSPERPSDGLARLILADRTTVGLVRMLVAATALYGLASIAVLVLRGRWLRTISTSGIEADAPMESDQRISELVAKLRQAQDERDEANRLLSRVEHG
jgi:hypothetical protein